MNQVLEIIKQRHHIASKPGKRTDPYKLGLAIEGGGLRGVVSGGALAALEALNLKDSFDVVYGASCGAYNGTYFVSGDVLTGLHFFLDYSQRQFKSLKRFIRGGPLFDLDYVQKIMHSYTPLNYKGVISANPPLHIVTSDAGHSRPATIKKYLHASDVDRALHASATIPTYKRPRPLKYKKRNYLDASILDPFCLHSAIDEGCTHILVLFSMPWQHRKVLRIVDQRLVAPYLSRINTNLAEMYLNHGEYSVNGLSHIWNHYDGTHILTVAPSKSSKLPGQITTNRKKLGHGFLAGAQSALHTFSPDNKTSQIILDNLKSELKI